MTNDWLLSTAPASWFSCLCNLRNLWIACLALISLFFTATTLYPQTKQSAEYLWYEAENMRGFATMPTGEPVLNPSWLNPPKAKTPGWGINGPGVSAEWSQGGESEWNSAAASADETKATIYQDIEVPRAGDYHLWVRYADWAKKTENFTISITQNGREVFRHEFGAKDVVDPHDEVSMYWGWAFTWDGAAAMLSKGPARLSIEIEKAAEARRHVDCVLVTNDLAYVPSGRQKPDFAAMHYLRTWSAAGQPLQSLIALNDSSARVPASWQRPKIAGRDFLMPWNIAKEFWQLYDKPAGGASALSVQCRADRRFCADVQRRARCAHLQLETCCAGHLHQRPSRVFEGRQSFLRYLRETKMPFAVLINYGSAQMSEGKGRRRGNC